MQFNRVSEGFIASAELPPPLNLPNSSPCPEIVPGAVWVAVYYALAIRSQVGSVSARNRQTSQSNALSNLFHLKYVDRMSTTWQFSLLSHTWSFPNSRIRIPEKKHPNLRQQETKISGWNGEKKRSYWCCRSYWNRRYFLVFSYSKLGIRFFTLWNAVHNFAPSKVCEKTTTQHGLLKATWHVALTRPWELVCS